MRGGDDLGGVDIVYRALQHPAARVGHGEEAVERLHLERGELATGSERRAHRGAVAAERHGIQPLDVWLEHAPRRVRRSRGERPSLPLAAPPEAICRGASSTVPAVHETLADLGCDQALAREHADGEAAQPHEQHAHLIVVGQRSEERLDVHEPVLALVVEAERRSHGDDLVAQLEPRDTVSVEARARVTLEGLEALAQVGSEYVSAGRDQRCLSSSSGEAVGGYRRVVVAVDVQAFVRANLPTPPARILEIGAGRGELARALTAAGYVVVAIDPEPAGDDVVRVALADLAEPSGSFDAAVAVVSLHHVQPLDESLRRLADVLRPGGVLVVDEFDCAQFDERAATWWLEQRRTRGGNEETDAATLVADMREELHSAKRIVDALAPSFDSSRPLRGSYLYRWELDESLRPVEEELIAQGRLNAVGVRFAAVRKG